MVSEIYSKSLDYDVEGMMDKIYTSQIGKEIAVLDENYLFFFKFSSVNMNKSPSFDLHAVHKSDTLNSELWQYATKSIDSNKLTKH